MLILWMFSPSFLLQLPPIHSAHIYSRLPEKSGNSCWSIQASSLPTVFQPLHLNMEFFTTCPQSLVLQFLPKPAVWIMESWPQPRRSFSRWRKQVLFDGVLLRGPVLSTWSLNLMVPGDPVVTSDPSTLSLLLTDFLGPLLRISPPG